jgi:hypothetical protein
MHRFGFKVKRVYAICTNGVYDGRAIVEDESALSTRPREACCVYLAGKAADRAFSDQGDLSPCDSDGANMMSRKCITDSGQFTHLPDGEARSSAVAAEAERLQGELVDEMLVYFQDARHFRILSAVAARLSDGPIDCNAELRRVVDSVS